MLRLLPAAALSASLVLVGCGALSPPPPCDAGTGGGATGGGSGGGAMGGGTGGGATGGGTGGGGAMGGGAGGGAMGGGAGGGVAGPFAYASVSITTTQSRSGYIVGLGGAGSDVYAVSDSGKLYHSTGAGFDEVLPSPVTAANYMTVLPDGAVFIVANVKLTACRSNCTVATSYVVTPTLDSTEYMWGLCGDSSSEVYAVGDRGSSYVGVLYKYDGSGWSKISDDLGVSNPKRCWKTGDTLYIAGQRDVVRYDINSASAFVEQPNYTGITANDADFNQWYEIGGLGPNVFVLGYRERIMQRLSGVWEWSLNPSATGTLRALAAVAENEMYAFQTGGNSADRVRKWDGSMWAAPTPAPSLTVTTPRAAWVKDANTFYVGGGDGSGNVSISRASR